MAIREVVIGKSKTTVLREITVDTTKHSYAYPVEINISGLYENYQNITVDNIFIEPVKTQTSAYGVNAAIKTYDASTGIIQYGTRYLWQQNGVGTVNIIIVED